MRIGSGLTIKGELTAAEDVTVDFSFEGYIDLPGHTLIVADGSHVKATVTARRVHVNGQLDGHISADRVEIGPTALVEGSVVTPKLALMDGAQFIGPVNTERAQAAANVAKHRQKSA
jgi:cytoskeletal protein CcmA (bactofilin family)